MHYGHKDKTKLMKHAINSHLSFPHSLKAPVIDNPRTLIVVYDRLVETYHVFPPKIIVPTKTNNDSDDSRHQVITVNHRMSAKSKFDQSPCSLIQTFTWQPS